MLNPFEVCSFTKNRSLKWNYDGSKGFEMSLDFESLTGFMLMILKSLKGSWVRMLSLLRIAFDILIALSL